MRLVQLEWGPGADEYCYVNPAHVVCLYPQTPLNGKPRTRIVLDIVDGVGNQPIKHNVSGDPATVARQLAGHVHD